MPINSTRAAGSAKGFGLLNKVKSPYSVSYLVIAGGGGGGAGAAAG